MLAVRLALAAVLVVSGLAKAAAPAATAAASRALGLPNGIARLSMVLLPALELAAAALLAVTPWARAGGALATVMMAGFTAIVLTNLIRGRRPACACFGGLSAQAPIGARTVVRNLVLLAASLAVLVTSLLPGRCAAGCFDEAGARHVLVGAAVVGALAIAGCLLLVHSLTATVGTLARRVRDLEGSAGAANATVPRTGFDEAAFRAAVPRMSVTASTGSTHRARDIVPSGTPSLLLFLSKDCSACARLTRQIRDAAQPPPIPLVALIDSWDPDHVPTDRLRLYSDGGALAEHVGISAFPAAVSLGPDAEPDGGVLTGTNEIRRFLSERAMTHA